MVPVDWILGAWLLFVIWAESMKIIVLAESRKYLSPAHSKLTEGVRTSLIIPFKGLENGLEKNIQSFLNQKAWETIFVVDSREDPVYSVLKKFSDKARIIESTLLPTCSGKCSAVIAGSEAASGDVLVFADSDGFPGEQWLPSLVNPLQDENVCVTSGYRWYEASGGFSYLKAAWDEIGIGLMLSRHAFVWGGSFAIMKKDFDDWKIQEKWRTSISDDTVVSTAVKKSGKRITFAPGALITSDASTSFPDFIEFTNRQIFMVRNFSKKAWKGAMFVYGYYPVVLASAIATLYYGYTIPGVFLVAVLLLPLLRSYIRRRFFERFLPKVQKLPSLFAPITTFITFYNLTRARFMKSVTWRGKKYSITQNSSPTP